MLKTTVMVSLQAEQKKSVISLPLFLSQTEVFTFDPPSSIHTDLQWCVNVAAVL